MLVSHKSPVYQCIALPSVLTIVITLSHQKWFVGKHGQIFLSILLFLFILNASTFCKAEGAETDTSDQTIHVLILNSYNQGFKWTDDIVAAVTSTMSAKLKKIEFSLEYMDTKRYVDRQLNELLLQTLALKYQRLQPDIIITSDDNALDFMQQHHQTLFPDVPVVFCGVNNVQDALSVDREYFTGLVETLDISANIDLVRHLLPKINEIVIVSDGTSTGIGTRQMAIDAERDYPNMTFIYLNGEELSTDEMLTRLRHIKTTTSAVLAPAWYLDKDGNTFDNKTIYPRIAEASPVPVFVTSAANLGMGGIGGKVNSGTIQGKNAANQALRILSGDATTKDLPVETKSQNPYMFDYRQLVRFAIDERRLPAGATILNRPVSFYERYESETNIAVVTFLTLLAIIALLMWSFRRRKQAEERLLYSISLTNAALESTPDGIFIVKADGTIVRWNQKFIDLFQIPQQLLHPTVKDPILKYVVAQMADPEVFLAKVMELYNHKEASSEDLLNLADGRIFERYSQPLKIGDEIVGRFWSFRDITEHKKMVRSVRESEERFRTLHNASFGGIVIHDQGIILDCNQGLSDLTGYAINELIGMDGLQLMAPDWREVVMAKILSGSENAYEVQGIRKDGTIYPLYIYGKTIPYKGRTVRVTEFRDISERKQAEAERVRLEAQLHQSQKMESIGQLAGGVAHDFNNMLGVILGHAEMAMEGMDPMQPLYGNLQEIRKAAERSANLTKQLLAFARKQTVAPKVIDLNQTIESMLQMLRRLIGENINLIWMPEKSVWPIKIDPSQIDQILANLCVNAQDSIIDSGQIIIQTHTATFDEADCENQFDCYPGEFVHLVVSDNGSGMDKETKTKLFEPFFTTKEVGQGTGLGLATVYGIVKQNKGIINVYSEPGQGTRFNIYLPRYKDEIGLLQQEESVAPIGRGDETILLVEDEPAILEIITMMLQQLGYTVLAANKPGEAIKMVKKHGGEIHLLMTDVVMPEMNGREIAQNLLAFNPNIKILFMSGYTADVIAHHGILDENVCFIQKPFSMHDLTCKLREVLDDVSQDHFESAKKN